MATSKLGDYIGTPAQVRWLDKVRATGSVTVKGQAVKALQRLRAHRLVTLTCEPHPNCGRPILWWTAKPTTK